MKVTPSVATLGGSLLAVVNFLQLEEGRLPHWTHIVIGAVSIFLATLLKPEKT
jgi:hypothetical protein